MEGSQLLSLLSRNKKLNRRYLIHPNGWSPPHRATATLLSRAQNSKPGESANEWGLAKACVFFAAKAVESPPAKSTFPIWAQESSRFVGIPSRHGNVLKYSVA
jgi:hypothetical protein